MSRVAFDGRNIYVDGKVVPRPTSKVWRGLSVIAEIDPAIEQLSGTKVFHLSVAAPRRKPTDEEVQEAIGEWVPKGMRLVEKPSVVNPYVRHFFDVDAFTLP